jgi:predicted acyl esterase
VARVDVELWPAAHAFRRGHRLRVQVSSGAHPRFARNLGGGEPFGSATVMHVAEQELWHDPDHRSAIALPVRDPL